MRNELKAITLRLTELLGKNSHEVLNLKIRLTCRNCKNSVCKNNVWVCNLYGDIPKDFIEEGCEAWVNNVAFRK